MSEVSKNPDDYVWESIRDIEHLGKVRMEAMELFFDDYEQGKQTGRYINASLPELPFENNAFDLAIAIEGSRSSTQEPEPGSRHLYAGHHLASKQVAARLVLKLRPSSVLMSIELRRLNDGSLVFVFLGSYLTCFFSCLFRNAHDLSF